MEHKSCGGKGELLLNRAWLVRSPPPHPLKAWCLKDLPQQTQNSPSYSADIVWWRHNIGLYTLWITCGLLGLFKYQEQLHLYHYLGLQQKAIIFRDIGLIIKGKQLNKNTYSFIQNKHLKRILLLVRMSHSLSRNAKHSIYLLGYVCLSYHVNIIFSDNIYFTCLLIFTYFN